MNINRILCPVDFSEYNRAANEYASMLAKSTGAQIIYLHAYLPEVSYGSPALFDAEKEERQIINRMKEEFKPTTEGIVAKFAVEFGTPAERIICYAKDHNVDMIVIGTHGRTGLGRIVMGSVAEAVVRRAECPVLAIKTESNALEEASSQEATDSTC